MLNLPVNLAEICPSRSLRLTMQWPDAVTSLAASCIPIVAVNFAHGNSIGLSPATFFCRRAKNDSIAAYEMVGSMGQVGSAGDNAAMESFFALLQKNVLDRRRWTTRDELRIAIVTWIERTYHRRRRQAALGRLTPIEYEAIMTPTTAQAA